MARIRVTHTERHDFQVPTYHKLSPQKFCLCLFFPSSDGSPARDHSNMLVLFTPITPDVYKSHSLRNFSVFTFSIHLIFTSYYRKFFSPPYLTAIQQVKKFPAIRKSEGSSLSLVRLTSGLYATLRRLQIIHRISISFCPVSAWIRSFKLAACQFILYGPATD
jgi:hypothetical protein